MHSNAHQNVFGVYTDLPKMTKKHVKYHLGRWAVAGVAVAWLLLHR